MGKPCMECINHRVLTFNPSWVDFSGIMHDHLRYICSVSSKLTDSYANGCLSFSDKNIPPSMRKIEEERNESL